jgi:hypothetical protein
MTKNDGTWSLSWNSFQLPFPNPTTKNYETKL